MSYPDATACPSTGDFVLAEIYAFIEESRSSPDDEFLAELHRLHAGVDAHESDPFSDWLAALYYKAPAPTRPSSHLCASRPLLTMKEAAKVLGFTSTRSLENLRFRGQGPEAIKLPSGGIRFDLEVLKRWVSVKDEEAGKRAAWQSHVEHLRKQKRQAKDQARHLERKGARKAQPPPIN